MGGVDGWVSSDGGGATSTVGVFNVPAAVAACAATLLQPAHMRSEPQFRPCVCGGGGTTAHKVQPIPVPAADQPRVDVMWADGPSPHRSELTVAPGV